MYTSPSARRLNSKNLTDSSILEYLTMLDTPRSLAVWLLYSSDEHHQLIALDSPFENWDHIGGVDYVRRSHASSVLLKKCDFLSLEVNRREAAIQSGLLAEDQNRKTNVFLRELREGRITDHEFNAILHSAARIVSRVLGTLDSALERIVDGGWTPGRSSAVSSTSLSHPEKYQASLDTTVTALPWARSLVRSSALWSAASLAADGPCSVLDRAFRIVNHNTALTVPKNAKTDRLICYEPHINIRLQRSVGIYIASRLAHKAKIDLSSQSANQIRACAGSKRGDFATIDLSMASDTLTLELVKDLVPSDWYDFLNSLRCRYTKWPDPVGIRRNEKFSSMGNGFTFELETLVFYALSVAASGDEDTLVYGDDIVVSRDNYAVVVTALGKAGFVVNSSKSFSDGYFRESCGEDYYRGVSVWAPRIKSRLEGFSLISWHNRVFEWFSKAPVAERRHYAMVLKPLRKRVDESFKDVFGWSVPRGPMGYGDGHLNANFDEVAPPAGPGNRGGWFGYHFHTLSLMYSPVRVMSLGSYNVRTSGAVVLNDFALFATALGPKAPLQLMKAKLSKHWKISRSRSFCNEWASTFLA